MQDTLVSIIVPAYKAQATIDATIDSVIAQTYGEWEMLIADDCSPDGTREVIETRSRCDSRIRLINMPRNGGPAAARNGALQQARGRWIAFLDSDDLWLPLKLEKCLAFALERKAALVFTGYRRISADGTKVGRYLGVPSTLSYQKLLGNTAIATSTVFIDRQQSGDISMRDVYYDDFVCWLNLLQRGLPACGLNEDLMRYRVMQTSVSRNKRRSAQKVWAIYRNELGFDAIKAAWYFGNYAVRGLMKYRSF